ncbi:MAG: SGNH/GDSL hydrolase family protein, partial [Candidatus Sumerlaeota bacterium]|nr:SGNH/GDSL hydrolase family protein [Candidatus Sumerlaeota bacterium]
EDPAAVPDVSGGPALERPLVAERRRRTGWKLAILLASLALCLAAAETALRLSPLSRNPLAVPPPRAQNPYAESPYLVYCRPFVHTHIPHSVYTQAHEDYQVEYRINARGFRGPEIPDGAPPGARRLLVIGDSFTEGHGVPFEKSFVSLLPEQLGPLGWECVGAGHQGYDILHYAANLTRYLALRPAAAVILFIDNDLNGAVYWEPRYLRLPPLDDPAALARGEAWQGPPALCLWTLARRTLWTRVAGVGAPRFEEIVRRHLKQEAEPSLRARFLASGYPSEDEFPAVWALNQDYLDLIAEEFRRRAIPLCAAYLPSEWRLASAEAGRRRFAELFEESLREWAAAQGIPFLSMSEALRGEMDADGRPAIWFPHDAHLNAYGHRVVADIVEPWLEQTLPR